MAFSYPLSSMLRNHRRRVSSMVLLGWLLIGRCPSNDAQETVPTASPASQSSTSTALTIGSPAPALQIEHWLSDGNGQLPQLQKFKPGHVYMVEFWATWCGPCAAAMPRLAEIQKRYQSQKFQLISVSDEALATVKAFLKRPLPASAAPQAEETPPAVEGKPSTYGELTSVYCLASDPDQSVSRDYMEAAQQRGIPTCFLVGKTGLIEWIGHPMEVEEPLQQVLNDGWDRQAFATVFRRGQLRDEIGERLSAAMRRERVDEAMAIVAEGKVLAQGDPVLTQMLEDAELQLKMVAVYKHLQSDEVADAMERLARLAQSATPRQLSQVRLVQLEVEINTQQFAAAEKTLQQIIDSPAEEPELLHHIAWQMLQQSQAPDFHQPLLALATAVAEKADRQLPHNPTIIATLARLYHRQGQNAQATKLLRQAIERGLPQADGLQAVLDELQP
jgi:thiol-disulfide isomerase/thioredoxin